MSRPATYVARDDVLRVLASHIGEARGAHVSELVRELERCRPDRHVDERHVRKVIEELRREGAHICATPRAGYFMAETSAELDDTCRFLFNRAMTSLTQVAAMKHVSLPDLEGQLKLKT